MRILRVISGFRREAVEKCALLCYYAAGCRVQSAGCRVQESERIPLDPYLSLWIPFGFLNPEGGTDRLSRNVGKKLPPLAA